MKMTILAAILMAAPSLVFATALTDLELATGADLRPLAQVQQNLQTGHKPNFLPRRPQDVLSSCRDIDAVFIRQPSLDEAVKTVNHCLEDRFGSDNKRLYSVVAEKCSQTGCGEINIVVRGNFNGENPFLFDDLSYSLNKSPRNGKIHGWPTKVIGLPQLAQDERHF